MTAENANELIEWARNDDDWLNDSEEEMLAEDTLWDEMFARNAEMFDALAKAADAEIEMGLTQPMFDADGKLITTAFARPGPPHRPHRSTGWRR
ncbi:MAG: hypothetical protein HY328_10715 [Chloroflexi bacterium]|nr:hypothetical protein [Chloroflexota bacterium]